MQSPAQDGILVDPERTPGADDENEALVIGVYRYRPDGTSQVVTIATRNADGVPCITASEDDRPGHVRPFDVGAYRAFLNAVVAAVGA
jgi:hypothetical protein